MYERSEANSVQLLEMLVAFDRNQLPLGTYEHYSRAGAKKQHAYSYEGHCSGPWDIFDYRV